MSAKLPPSMNATGGTEITDDLLNEFRLHCDPLADNAVQSVLQSGYRGRDLWGECRRLAAREEGACRDYVQAAEQVPDWVNFDDFRPGQELFIRNGVFTLLVGFTVLVESYTGAMDNKVLLMSGRLTSHGAFRRLVETARFAWDVVQPGGLRPGAPGATAILKVRLLHAWVRVLCRRGDYDVEQLGEPINQEAMCGTLMLFSHGVLKALQTLGVRVSEAEGESYHKLWRYAGALMGVDERLLPETWAGERALYEQIKARHYFPDEATTQLFEAAVVGVARESRDIPFRLALAGGFLLQSEAFLRHFTFFCVDPRLSEHLGLSMSKRWRGVFGGLRMGMRRVSPVLATRPILRRGATGLQRRFVERYLKDLEGLEPAKYDNPGFHQRR